MRSLSILSAAAMLSTGLAVTLPAAPAAAQSWQDVTCESWNYREAVCPVPGAQRVQLLRVRGGDCFEGQTWFHDGRAIHVRNGCRATFRIDANAGWGAGGWDDQFNDNWNDADHQVQRIRCESWNFRDQRCPVNGVISSVHLIRVIAGDCRDGATWRWNRNAIRVRGGCRADFEVLIGAAGWAGGGGRPGGGFGGGFGGGVGGGNQPIVSINCESWNFQPARCAIPRGRQAQLERVFGGNCRQGQTWGVQAGSIWVNGGCRAAFRVY